MTRKGIVGFAGAVVATAVLAQGFVGAQAGAPAKAQTPPAPAAAQKAPPKPAEKAPSSSSTSGSLGSVHIPNAVMADGKTLPAGTYTLRLSSDPVSPVVGQTPDEAKWVEFVQGSAVKGREVATVLTTADAKQIAKLGLPAPGSAKVQTLKGNEYTRVWINKGGTNYLVHLKNS